MGGQCCKAYYDLTFEYHAQEWCSDYCCGSSALGVLECCDNVFLSASDDDTTGTCVDFFLSNIWVPILIGIGGILGCIFCVAVCVGVCGGKKTGGVVNQTHPQPATNVIMMTPGGAQQQPQGHQPFSYGAQPGPSGPYGYGGGHPGVSYPPPPQYPGNAAPFSTEKPGVGQPDSANNHPFSTS